MRVGYFPFKPGGNPYQDLFAQALEGAGHEVQRIPPRKLFALQYALSHDVDLLQLDWPHDWYQGRNLFTRLLKQFMYARGLSGLRKKPAVWTAHNLVAHDTRHFDYEKRMIQKLVNAVDGIIVMSGLARQQLEEIYQVDPNVEIEVVPHGHYMDVYPNSVNRDEARKILELDAEKKVVLSLGRLMPYKGLEDLITAFASLNLKDSTLLIAGSCTSREYADRLLKLAGENSHDGCDVRIKAEFIADDHLQYYFNAADVVALPFRNILNSGSLLLAMSFGKCVIAPDSGSIREVVCREGWIPFQPGGDNALPTAIETAMTVDDFTEREKIVNDFTRQNYDWRLTGVRASNLYDRVLQKYL